VAARAIVTITKEKIKDEVWVYGHYVVDILPFEEESGEAGEVEEKGKEKEKEKRNSRNTSNPASRDKEGGLKKGQVKSEDLQLLNF
jgi:hypothetical protein